MTIRPRRPAPLAAAVLALALVGAACSDDDSSAPTTTLPTSVATGATSAASSSVATGGTSAASSSVATGGTSASTPVGGGGDGVSASGISPERCAANKAAGKITYLSSFDFSASASILDVIVARDKGYFTKLCLDVELRPSFSLANYPLVAANQGQMSGAGSFSELVKQSVNGAELVAVVDYGKTPIEALVVRDDGQVNQPGDLRGKTIGVKGALPPSLVAMLSQAGLKQGQDYKEVLLDGFDPKAHLQQAIDALPVYKSNEPGQLDAAGIKYKLFDPATAGVPGSFGLLYTSKQFLADHPTAVQDFARASLKGYQDAVADPAGAVAASVAAIDAAGNQNFLTAAGETYRWQQESKVVQAGTPAGQPVGAIDGGRLQAEVDAYTAAGIFAEKPDITARYDETIAKGAYDSAGKLIWPG